MTTAKMLLLFSFLVGCSRNGQAVSPISSDQADAQVAVADAGGDAEINEDSAGKSGTDNCSIACLNLQSPAVHCSVGLSVDGGESCAKTCRHARDSRLMPLDIPCAMKAHTSQEAHNCRGWGC